MFKKYFCLVSLGGFCLAVGGCAPLVQLVHRSQQCLVRGRHMRLSRMDQYCQVSAQQAIDYQSPGEAANRAAVGSAAVGTALGALTGAAIGSASGNVGAGAAIGAGTGLVAGSAVGAGNARAAGGSLQARYDTVYAQCMSAKGNRLAAPYVPEQVYVYPRPYYWGPGYYYRYGW
jgi:Glycine-zipper domain